MGATLVIILAATVLDVGDSKKCRRSTEAPGHDVCVHSTVLPFLLLFTRIVYLGSHAST